MNKIKFTGANIAAALLILAYFFPWAGSMGISMSGFSVATYGISPGVLAYFITGFSRLLMILTLIIPISGALILYQNITGNLKFNQYFKLAHIIPALYIIACIIILYFKMKPDAAPVSTDSYGYDQMMKNTMNDMAPSIFDVLGFGVYLSLIASVYLLLVGIGKVKDKEYYKPSAVTAENNPPGTGNE